MDIYVKKAIIHQFSPADTELLLADKFLNITPKIEEYLRKKIERVYSDDAKTGVFDPENVFLAQLSDDLLETSVTVAKLWQEEFSVSENQKTNDLIFVQFDKEGVEHFAFLRIALRETLTHLGGEVDNPIKLTQNNLPGFGTGAIICQTISCRSIRQSQPRNQLKRLRRRLRRLPKALIKTIFSFSPRSNPVFSKIWKKMTNCRLKSWLMIFLTAI